MSRKERKRESGRKESPVLKDVDSQEQPPAEGAEDDVQNIDTRRNKQIQVKVSANLKRRAIKRGKELDMGLSEYIRFLLYCDIHGFTPSEKMNHREDA